MMLILLAMLQETPEDIYKYLERRNIFSSKLEKPKPPPPERKPREEKPVEPEKPKTFRFDVAGIVLHNADQVYEALVCDREYDEAKWMRAGDAWHEAKVMSVSEGAVEISVADQTHSFKLGNEFEMLVEGRKGGGRSSPRREEEKPKPEEKPPEEAVVKPADEGEKPKVTGAKGLLDKYRKAKGLD